MQMPVLYSLDLEPYGFGPQRVISRPLDPDASREDLAARHHEDCRIRVHTQITNALDRYPEAMRVLGLVDDLHVIDIFRAPVIQQSIQRIAVADDIQCNGLPQCQGRNPTGYQQGQKSGIDEHARPQNPGRLVLQRMLGGIANQTLGRSDLGHDGVACIDASGASNALQLQPTPYVYPCGTNLHAPRAVDTVTRRGTVQTGSPTTSLSRLASLSIIGDHERIAIEHRALKARIR